MTVDDLHPHVGTPGDLFAYLWSVVEPHVSAMMSTPWRGGRAAEFAGLVDELRRAPGPGVPKPVVDYLSGTATPSGAEVPASRPHERAYVVMAALDVLALVIHPRRGAGLTASARPAAVPPIVAAMRDDRWALGHFGGGAGLGVTVPKGPLTRPDLDEGASGDRLDICFANLTVVGTQAGRTRVNVAATSPASFRTGVGGTAPRIGTAAVAVGPDDLAFEASDRGGRPFLDARPTDPPRLADVTATAVVALLDAGSDLVVLPELCVGEVAVAETIGRLRGRRFRRGALVVLGSGLSAERCAATGLHFNECVVVDARGRVLWRQRKANHFRMSRWRMDECDLPNAGDEAHAEDCATGEALEVHDLPGLGRVVVLICEDLQQPLPGGQVVAELRPDWVLTPVLDVSQGVTRWTAVRAAEVGRVAGSRVVVSCSGTLDARKARKASGPLPDVGQALLVDAWQNRRFKVLQASGALHPGGGHVTDWLVEDWDRFDVVGVPPRPGAPA